MRAWIDAGSGGAVVVVLGVGVASVVGAGVAAPDTDGALVAPPLLATVGAGASPPPPVQAPTASRAVSVMPM